MKCVVLIVVLVGGVAYARDNPPKKAIDCTGFPKEFSGRIIEVTNTAQGKLSQADLQFNFDFSLQRLQAEETIDEQGHYNIILDYNGGKTYIIFKGHCYTEPLMEKLPNPGDLTGAKSLAQGSLGVQGPNVDVYEIDKEESHEVITVQSGGQCIPLTFAVKTKDGSSSTGSFLDLKTTADPEKLQIPEECKQQQVNDDFLVSAMTHRTRDVNNRMKQTLKRTVPWLRSADQNDQNLKRGLPWVLPGLTGIITERE